MERISAFFFNEITRFAAFFDLILYFYFFHSQKRTHRDSIPFKEGAKEKESLQEFSVEKSPSFERERERGGKIDPHPISSTNNETIEQMEIGDVAGYQPASHAGAKQRRPCFSSEKSGIYTPLEHKLCENKSFSGKNTVLLLSTILETRKN